MKQNKTKDEGDVRPRRKSSRNSSVTNESDVIPAKAAKVNDLKQLSDGVKNNVLQNETKLKKESAVEEAKTNNVNETEQKLPENIDRRVISFEESEAEERDSAKDLTEFQKTCTNIESKLSIINELKKGKNSSQNVELINDYRIDATLLTTNLKKLNRLTQIRGKIAKEKTQEVKKKVDGLHLDLQNLLYELRHVRKEIQKCMNFSSKDEEIDLVDVEKFYEEAPTDISQPELTKESPHQQMLARLDWELKKRKELSVSKDELVKSKKKTEAEINQKVDYLSNLKPRLEQIIKASRPVQEYMKIPLEAESLLQEKAQFLPRPLYVLYIQAKAYKDVCDNNIEVDIQGDLLEAKSLFYRDDDDDDDEDIVNSDASENETETETEVEEKRNGRKHKRDKERLNEQQSKLLKPHPLTVLLTIREKGSFQIELTFNYYPLLKINAVKTEVELEGSHGIHNKSPLLCAADILQDLLSPDTGRISPNSANVYQLQRLKMNGFEKHVEKTGYPYFWVQWICGLNYLPNEDISNSIPDASLSVKHFQNVVKKIKSRLRSRLSLQEQVSSLEKLLISEPKKETMKEAMPKKTMSMLTKWTESTFEEFQKLKERRQLEELGVVNEDCIFYKAVFTRDEAVEVMIILHTDYPNECPLLLLSLKDGELTVNANTDLRGLESEVNSYVEELMENGNRNLLLSNMLRRLQFCFDIYCETGPKNEMKERLFARKARGRDRCRPYVFHTDGYFVQR